MKPLITSVALALALGAPLAALADEGSSPSNAPATTAISGSAPATATKETEKTGLVVVKSEKRRDPLADFVMPKYLTIQQENEARQRAYEALFGLNHTP
jgi:hypothetical protein